MKNSNLNGLNDDLRARPLLATTNSGWAWYKLGVIFGLGGGLACVLFGSIITASTWFMSTVGYEPLLHKLGTLLLVLTIPLLIFGAHCLDLIERQHAADKASPRR